MLAAALGALALVAPAAAFLPQQQHARPALPVPALAAKKKSGGGGGGGGGGRRAPVDKALQTALETWEPVIGIEIHTQLLTASKAYCSCPVQRGLDVAPNTYVCPVCMAEPGALPTVNSKVLELACKAGMALGCEIAERCKYDRKNYFYPDTPKNYQITQYVLLLRLLLPLPPPPADSPRLSTGTTSRWRRAAASRCRAGPWCASSGCTWRRTARR